MILILILREKTRQGLSLWTQPVLEIMEIYVIDFLKIFHTAAYFERTINPKFQTPVTSGYWVILLIAYPPIFFSRFLTMYICTFYQYFSKLFTKNCICVRLVFFFKYYTVEIILHLRYRRKRGEDAKWKDLRNWSLENYVKIPSIII